jgi:hypothetical protein
VISLTFTRDATMLPDVGLAIIILGTVALALAVNIGAALSWLRRRR